MLRLSILDRSFLERAMYEKTLVLTLLVANLANVVCLYSYL